LPRLETCSIGNYSQKFARNILQELWKIDSWKFAGQGCQEPTKKLNPFFNSIAQTQDQIVKRKHQHESQ
jgi:hypothetical protein